jgi:hypothetical protein
MPRFLFFEFQQARYLFYDELMFGAQGLPQIRVWVLKDNLDTDIFGWFFG